MSRIVIATPFESRLAKRGTRLPVLADLLAARGHDVEYVTAGFSHARKQYYNQAEVADCVAAYAYKTTVLNVPGYRTNISIRRVLSHICLAVAYFRYLAKTLAPSDLLVIPSRPPELIFTAFLMKRRRSIKVHMDITDLWPDTLGSSSRWRYWPFRMYCELFQRRAIKHFDSFSHISPCALPWLRRYAPTAGSCFVPLGYDQDRWASAAPPETGSGPIRVVYVGTLSYHFDLGPVLRAMQGVANVELSIIGDGDRRRDLEAIVEECKLSNVRFLGRLAPKDVVREMTGHHIGLSPEITAVSVMPNKLFDYIACYLPILVLGENDSARFVEERRIGWSLPFDDSALRAFFTSISWTELRDRISQLERIRPEYSKTRLYSEYMNCLEDCARASRG